MFDESGHTWDQQVEDYENSRASTIAGLREITDEYDSEDLDAATPQVLYDFIHEVDQHEACKALDERLYRVSMERPVNECRSVVVKAASVADASKVALTANFDESQLDDWTPCDPGDVVVYGIEPVDDTEPLTPISGE